MNIQVMNRLKAVEMRLKKRNTPELVSISFNPLKVCFEVAEHYGQTVSIETYEHYKEYTFTPEFNGVIFLDLISAPALYPGNFYTFNACDIRAKVPAELGFSIELLGHEDPLQGELQITPCVIS